MAQVAGSVPFDLAFPPRAAGFRQPEVRTVLMSVPEAAVDEDDGAVFGQDDVGPAGELAVLRAADGEAVTQPVEHGPDKQLGLGVAPADAGHELGAFLRAEDVHGGVRAEMLKN